MAEKDLAERTLRYARNIIRLYSNLPKHTVAQTIGKQLLRSGTSVGANYREAHRSRSKAEFIAKIGDCLKEIEESAYWLELVDVEQLSPPSTIRNMRAETDELIAILVTIKRRAKTTA